jgi:hypothetical protein
MLRQMMIFSMLSIALVSCEIHKFDRDTDQYLIRINETEQEGLYRIRCFVRAYDLNKLDGLEDSIKTHPMNCDNIKGYVDWDSYIVPRAEYIKRNIKCINK